MAEASRTAGMIEKVQIGNTAHSIASTAYGVCDTTSGVTEKTVAMTGFVLYEGVTVHVKFLNTNSVASPTLNVNGTGAKEIKLYGTTAAGTNAEREGWQAGAVVSFTYDGTYWIRDQGYNTNTTYTIKDTYSGTDGNPISGKGVKAALQTLDGNLNNTTPAASKTLTAFSETDGIVSATFGNIAIAESQVTNLTADLGNKMPKAGGTFTGNVDFSSGKTLSVNAPTADSHAATKKYVDDKTAGLTGAMHFIGTTSTTLTDGATTATLTAKTTGSLSKTTGFVAGDVVLYGDQEFVWNGAAWELLGDEGSYALKSKTDKAIKSLGFTANTKPTLTITNKTIPNVTGVGTKPSLTITNKTVPNVTSAGSMTSASVTNAILTITNGSAPTLGDAFSIGSASGWSAGTLPTLGDAFSIGSASGWNAGTQASVNPTSIDVVIP